jgi:hypothetical protein
LFSDRPREASARFSGLGGGFEDREHIFLKKQGLKVFFVIFFLDADDVEIAGANDNNDDR